MTNTAKKMSAVELEAHAMELNKRANGRMTDEDKINVVNKFKRSFDLAKERLEAERELVNYDLVDLEKNIKAADADPLSYFEKNGPFQFKKSDEHLKAEERYKTATEVEADTVQKQLDKSSISSDVEQVLAMLADIVGNKKPLN